jgi:Cu/Zn superoxide dismutase
MTIHVMLMGLDAGPHGMHVHMGTDCMAPGTPESAGRAARTCERGFWHAPSR